MTTAVSKTRPDLAHRVGRLFKASPGQVREAFWGSFFVSPWIVGLILFTFGPILASVYFGFTKFDVLGTPKWVGLDNYA